ncbi:MAG: glycosyltransferase family 2 protein [Thermodesulfovibrionales bacterium]
MSSEKAYIVILNWNGWKDTLECLESVFRSDYPNYQVIVCDNDSTDGSLEHIRAWAEGREIAMVPDTPPVRLEPPVAKPIAYAEYGREQAEAGGADEMHDRKLVLIRTGANLGFAGGTNVGLRYALRRGDFGYAWLLNNDTVVRHDALSNLVSRCKESGAGITGSKMPYYDDPHVIWALGGATYNKWLAIPECIGLRRLADEPNDCKEVEARMAYVAGASMLVSRDFLRDIGLMQEDYFLYYEELDWAQRAKGRYSLAYAPGSIVYHKVGASTGRNMAMPGGGSAEHYMRRNALLVTYRFFPLAVPSVCMRFAMGYARKKLPAFLKRTAGEIVRRIVRRSRQAV